MESIVLFDQENAKNVLRSKENNVSRDMSKRCLVLGVLNSKQPFNKQTSPKSKVGLKYWSTYYSYV